MIFSVFLWMCWVELRLTQPTFYSLYSEAIANLVGWVEATKPNMIFSVFLWMCWVELRLTQPTFYSLYSEAIANLVSWVEVTKPNIIFSRFMSICWVELRLTQPTFYSKIRLLEHPKYLLVRVTSALQLARDDLSVTILLSLVQSHSTG